MQLTYDYTATWPRSEASAIFYLPVPPTTGGQQIDSFRSNLHGSATQDSDTPARRVLRGVIHHEAGDERQLEWRVQITGTLETRQLVDGPGTAGQIPGPGAGSFLGESESIDWRSEAFQDWLDRTRLRRTTGEAPVAFGRRVYDYLVDHGSYEYPPQGGWIASGAVRRLRTDCGGFSLVFTAACRANRIPARLLVGQWFKTRESGGDLEQTGRQSHVIAEFFDPGIGWIPEDVSSTLMRVPGPPNYDYFGRDPGYFFTWHFDTDFHFAVPEKSDEHVQWIQNPSPWFEPDADSAAESSSHHWSLQVLD